MSNAIKSIVKAAEIIDLLTLSENPLSLSEMSKELNIAKSTLHGILGTLVHLEYVTQSDEDGKYSLGMKLFEIGSTISMRWDARRIARPYMESLAEKTGETIHLGVLRNGEVLYIDKKESSGSIRIVTETGLKLPAHCTGVGKVLLSGLDAVSLDSLIEKGKLEKYTDTTITDMKHLKKELGAVRKKGYAIDEQEFMVGLRCIATPIYDHAGEVTCAISISGPLVRMSGDILEKKKKQLLKAAESISYELGYR